MCEKEEICRSLKSNFEEKLGTFGVKFTFRTTIADNCSYEKLKHLGNKAYEEEKDGTHLSLLN